MSERLREGLREQLSSASALDVQFAAKHFVWLLRSPELLGALGGAGVRAKPLALIWRGVKSYAHSGTWRTCSPILAINRSSCTVTRRFGAFGSSHAYSNHRCVAGKAQPLNELIGRGLADEAYVRRLSTRSSSARQLESVFGGRTDWCR